MPRQPFLTRYRNSGLSLGAGFLEQRPKAAALIAECVAGWTEIELQVARLLAAMLKANTEPTIALYFTLANERAKREALNAIADYVFVGKPRPLFDLIFKAKGAIASDRNDLAHGLFGLASEETEGVDWISTKDRIRHMIQMNDGGPVELADYHKLKEFVSVYTIPDIKKILDDIVDLHRIMYAFVGYVGRNPIEDSTEQLYQQLLNEPLLLRFQSPKGEDRETSP